MCQAIESRVGSEEKCTVSFKKQRVFDFSVMEFKRLENGGA